MEHTIDEMLKAIERSAEENEWFYTELVELKRKCAKLVAENERLECICESYALRYGTVTDKEVILKKERADTVRKMQERFSALLEKEYKELTPEGASQYFKNGSLMMTATAQGILNQIAKEMLEDKKNDNRE